jgi:predicted TIM-barrel fold metal-dependent hydrolase
MFWLGEDKLIFGADYAIWEPRWQVEGFVDWQMPVDEEMADYAQVTVAQKKKILGLNAARLYDIKVPGELEAEKEQSTEAVGVPSP